MIDLRAALRRLTLVSAVCILSVAGRQAAGAAQPSNVMLVASPETSSNSALLDVTADEQLHVVVSDGPQDERGISVFVHSSSGELVCRDDPDGSPREMRCQPPAAGKYYVRVQNSGSVARTIRVEVEQLRGQPEGRSEFATVRVQFATNREAVDDGFFGSVGSRRLTYGQSEVSIPREHRMGELEGPSILRLQWRSKPSEHIQVLSVRAEPEAQFWARLRSRVAASKERETLLFVPGFNVTFEDALRRLAQISYDLAFDGPVVLFSWPSAGSMSPLAYQRDVRSADAAAESLAQLLEGMTREAPNASVHIIAHSMGNRVLTTALQRLETKAGPTLRQVAMMAPDVDRELFEQIAPRIAKTARRTTVYASSRDIPMVLAGVQAGAPRAGAVNGNPVAVKGVDTIDVSEVETSRLGLFHSYYGDNSSVLADLFWLMRGKAPQDRFGLEPVDSPGHPYWRFRPKAR